jgi:hypothetical protein
MLASVHQFQEIKICKARDECGPAKAIHVGNADAFTACRIVATASRSVGGAVTALHQRTHNGVAEAGGCCFMPLCVVNTSREAISCQRVAQQCAGVLVDGRLKKNARGARPITTATIDIVGALKRLGSRLPSSFLFEGRVLPSPSSTTSTLVLARQTITISPSALGLLF